MTRSPDKNYISISKRRGALYWPDEHQYVCCRWSAPVRTWTEVSQSCLVICPYWKELRGEELRQVRMKEWQEL